MLNLLIAIAAAALVYVGLGLAWSFGYAAFPAVAALLVVYFLLARRTSRQVEAVMPEVQKLLMARRPDQAIALLQEVRKLGRWQFLVASAIDAQIGMILYAHKQDFDAARPYLEKAFSRQWQPKAMLAVEGRPVFSVQQHPEASPGPQDSYYLFERFVAAMGGPRG